MPDASILITTYDRYSLLVTSINSALAQTHDNIEVIISNDNPERTLTSESLNINDKRVSVFNTAGQLGEINNMNHLLSLSNSSWVTWLADDDLLHPRFVEVALKAVTSPSFAVSAFYSGYQSFSNDSDLFKTLKSSHYDSPSFYNKDQFLCNYLDKDFIPVGTMGLMNKQFLFAIGGVQQLGSSFSPYSDTLIPLQLSKYGHIAFCSTGLAYYRVHPGSVSSSNKCLDAYQSAQLDFVGQLRCKKLLQNKPFNYRLCKLFTSHLASTLQRTSVAERLSLLHSALAHQQKIATLTKLSILERIKLTLLFGKSLIGTFFH